MQDLLYGGIVVVVLVAQPRIVVEMTTRLGFLVHHGNGELAVVEVPAELITVIEDRDLQGVQRVGAAVQHLLAQDRGDEPGQVIGLIQLPDRPPEGIRS